MNAKYQGVHRLSFFLFDTRILVKLSRYTSWLFFGVWIVVLWWSQQYRSDGNQNDTAGKSCLSYKASLPYSQPDFFYPIFCLHRKQLQRIASYSIALDHFFVSAFTMKKEDKQTEKFWSIFVWDNIYIYFNRYNSLSSFD